MLTTSRTFSLMSPAMPIVWPSESSTVALALRFASDGTRKEAVVPGAFKTTLLALVSSLTLMLSFKFT